MLKLKFLLGIMYVTGFGQIIASQEVQQIWVSAMAIVCGFLTVGMGVLGTSYLGHISNVPAHTPPPDLKEGSVYVTDSTCLARIGRMEAKLDGIVILLEEREKKLNQLSEFLNNLDEKRSS